MAQVFDKHLIWLLVLGKKKSYKGTGTNSFSLNVLIEPGSLKSPITVS